MDQWPIIVLLLIASVILPPLAVWWLSQRSRLSPFLHSLAGVSAPFMGVMSLLFSLNLVFVCNEIWQSRERAELAMSREAEALRNIGRIASNVPERGGLPIMEAARQYLEAVIEFDFAKDSASADLVSLDKSSLPAVINLADVILDGSNLDKIRPAVRTLLITQLTVARDNRLERVALQKITPNKVKWFSLLFLEFAALLGIAVVHVVNGRALLVACFIFLGGTNPFLAALYSSRSPFSGIDPLHNKALAAALDRLKSMEEVYKKG